ncbi:hypothetical protein RRF57_001241 [Xylaria bambusicola]|uniref:Uncharacterized protein n=1 Tax=Xylaria bambusicola TaxID=326684 RepID=A0AAN7U571_9PEZI
MSVALLAVRDDAVDDTDDPSAKGRASVVNAALLSVSFCKNSLVDGDNLASTAMPFSTLIKTVNFGRKWANSPPLPPSSSLPSMAS